MRKYTMLRSSAVFAMLAASVAANAQSPVPVDVVPTLDDVSTEPEEESDWQVGVGVVAIYGPAFLGSKDYQGLAAPNIEIRYKDRLFISVLEGLGYDLIKTDNLRAGPIIGYEQKRKQSGKNPFALIGKDTQALRGLGDTKDTIEVGGFAEYEIGDAFSLKGQVRYGVNGHKGIVGEFSAEYMAPLGGMTNAGQPVMFGFGPQMVVVDKKWNDTYFGISPTQSLNSGLREFNAKGGILSYGISSTLIVPLTSRISAAAFASYDRLAGDAASSPLVRERGSRNQGNIGLGLVYRFGRAPGPPGRPPE